MAEEKGGAINKSLDRKTTQNKFIIFLLIFMIVVAGGLTLFLYKIFSSEGGECLMNPMNYAEKKMIEKDNSSVVVCTCTKGINFGINVWEVDLNGSAK